MTRLRTGPQAFREIKAADPNTCVSERQIFDLLRSGSIPVIHQRSKILVSMDILEDYFANPEKYNTSNPT